MPLEIPRSPVQHLRHRASGFSIPGRLPCLLAVVLGLFAHSEALAQSALDSLNVTPNTGTITLDPTFSSATDDRTFTADVVFGVTQVTVVATATGWDVTYLGAADADGNAADYQRDLRLGSNTITVRATSTADPPETPRNYTIRVTRAPEIGSALSALSLSVGTLDPVFDAATDDRTFTADVALSVTTLTVTATAKPGWEDVTFHDGPDADSVAAGYQRNLAVGANRITVRATPTGASGTRNYTITVTRTTTPSEPRNLRAASDDRSVRLTWTAPSSDGGMDIVGYDFRSKDADEDDGQWMDDDTWSPIPGSDDSTTSHDVDSLINGTTYLFQVRARNANSNTKPNTDPQGSASNTAEATPARPLPAPVWTTDPPAVVAGHRRVTLSWTRIPDATTPAMEDESVIDYQYRRRVGTGAWGGWTTIADSDLVESGTTRSYTVTGLTNDTTYRFQVRGRSSVGDGAASTEREGTPEAGAPGAPTNLRATAGDEQVTLSWTAPSDNGGEPITGYEYRYREQSADPAVWTATGGTGTTATVYSLNNGTTYFFQVRAVNDVDCADIEIDPCGQPSLESSATPVGEPETRVDLTNAEPEDRRVTLTWRTDPSPPRSADELSGFQYRQKADGGYGRWIDVRNSNASTARHVVAGLTNGTTYTFQVRAVNSSGGGDASGERSAVPSTTPGAPTLAATAGDEEVRLTWTAASDGGRRISGYECQRRWGADAYGVCTDRSIGPYATSLTLTDEDVPPIANDTTYTFQVRAVNGNGSGDWSNEASERPTDSPGTARSFTISATIDGKSWAKAGSPATIYAKVEVNRRFTEPSTPLWVTASGGFTLAGQLLEFRPADSSRDASFTHSSPLEGDVTIALFTSKTASLIASNALAVTRVEIRPATTPDPPRGLVATRGNGEVILSWATVERANNYEYRQRRQPGSYGRWTDFAGDEFQRPGTGNAVTSNTVTGLTNGGTYAFQVRALDTNESPSGPSDEVSVSLSGTVETGALSAPRNLPPPPATAR